MRLTTLFRLAVITLALGVVPLATPAQDQSDDVAAAARKAREQQKNAPKPKKVLTNDEIPSTTPSTSATGTTENKAEGAEGAGQAGKENADENNPKSEAYWRKRFQAAHDKLAQAEKDLDILQRDLDKNQVQYYSDPQKAMMQEHDRTDLNEKSAKVDAKRKEIEALKQQLSDMEDELRKAGGDPGWAR
ncbi:MAG TPA: hypothetical protein VEI54_09180 [Candidatus Limnocylindrales bacterium]|nr:hypothetical protein [Candidatus Limnocylindrales bacterium]